MHKIFLLSISITCLLIGIQVQSHTIALIGTGNVSSALGPRFADMGHTIIYGSRSPFEQNVKNLVALTGPNASATSQSNSVVAADIIVLAIPGGVIDEVVKQLGNLAGKIIIDPINAVRLGKDSGLALSILPSAAERIQKIAPAAHVVKAFNTVSARFMRDPESAGGPITIPLAGDSSEAKAIVASLVSGLGLEALDIGPLKNAQYLEYMGLMYIAQRSQGRGALSFEYHLRIVPR